MMSVRPRHAHFNFSNSINLLSALIDLRTSTGPSFGANASQNAYLKDVHKYREEIADGVENKPMAQQLIMQAYRVNSLQDVDTIRNKFYNDKFGRKATPEDDAVFKYAYSSIFGANKYNEDDFSFSQKEDE